MRGPQIQVENSFSQIEGLPQELFRLLRYELSQKMGDPGVRLHQGKDGSVQPRFWDGYRAFLKPNGVFPTGLIPRVCRLLGKWRIQVGIKDLRVRPKEQLPLWTLSKKFVLRDYQEAAVTIALATGRGVIDIPPRGGKTLIMAELQRRISDRTIITAPTRAVASQTYDRLLESLHDWSGLPSAAHDFYLLTGGPPKTPKEFREFNKATVFCATADTALAMPQDWWDGIVCWMSDERHHQAADTYHKLNEMARNAYYRFGFTGTNFRSDPTEQIALEVCLGRTIVKHSIADMRRRGVLVGGRVEFWPIRQSGLKTVNWKRAYAKGIVDSDIRNTAVVAAVNYLLDQDRRVLVLVQQIAHGEKLRSMIAGSEFVQGDDGEEVRKAVARLDSGKLRVLIGSPVVGEGLDCPAADALVYAKGYQAKVTHMQDTFRVLTGFQGKKDAVVVDFADRHNTHLIGHAAERMRNYHAMGLQIFIRDEIKS